MNVERCPYTRSFTLRDDDLNFIAGVSFREVQALVACRYGLARARLRRRGTAYLLDWHLEPECDVWGIGFGTLENLQFHGLILKREDEGQLFLTDAGGAILDAILGEPGVSLPPLVTEMAA